MRLKKVYLYTLGLAILAIVFSSSCGRKSETGEFETDDVSQFDGPYDYVKTNDNGSIIIKKDEKEYTFEFLGLPKGEYLAKEMLFFFDNKNQIWIEYDENKLSPQGNLQGYAYYENKRVHDINSGNITSRGYRMINAYQLWGQSSEFVDDGQTHKHFEMMLSYIIKGYKDEIEMRGRSVESPKGSIYVGRSTSDLQSKLTEYERALAEYRAKKQDE